ncbi:uncharacterized protein LOC114131568 isoform X1 [Aphis gossypii]|uniref:Major facilitator superfamily (MFS) profile domain-containing protein n=1 Tax=Aphis gossypii TaxID=80765 RepID=A0A9P0NJK8_APHGO|nr:uncharacterized protein LOC114131568 isoform X1 [Aphis gossypii]CAH1725097.1 unnamed protein product [Aphis gossypii]
MDILNINTGLLPIKAHFFLYYAANSPINPFLSTIAKQRGYSSSVFGNILTLLLLLTIVVKPLTGYITDRWKCRRTVFLCAILLNGLITPTLYLIPGATSSTGELSNAETFGSLQFWWFAAVVILRMILFMIGEVLQETICIKILDGDTEKFGKQRLWGAAGWGIMSMVAGAAIDWYSSGLTQKNHLPGYLISASSFLIDFIVVLNLKVPETSGPTTNILKDVKIVLKNAKVCVFLVWATAGGMFMAYICYYFIWYVDDLATIYHPERMSMLSLIAGLSLTIDCFGGEVPFFYLSGHLIKRTGHMTAFSISFAMFALRFLLYSVIRDPLWVLPVEMLNGITFGLSYIAGISYSAKIAPVGCEGTVQGLFSMAFLGIGSSLGVTLAGYTFSHLGSVMAFRLIGFIALITCVIQIVVNHFMNRNKK